MGMMKSVLLTLGSIVFILHSPMAFADEGTSWSFGGDMVPNLEPPPQASAPEPTPAAAEPVAEVRTPADTSNMLGDLSSLNSSTPNCTAACSTGKVCDMSCVKACESCAKTCNNKMCTKKSNTNFVCAKDDDDDEDTKSSGNKSDAARKAAQNCVDNNSDAISSCTSSQSSADNSCNADKNAGIGGTTDLAAALALALGQMTSSGVQSACGSMAGLSQGSNAALAGYRANCNSSKNSCTNSCSSAKSKVDQCAKNASNPSDVQKALADISDYNSLTSAASKCKALQTKVDQADQAIKNMATTQQNAQKCQQATSAMSTLPQDCTNATYAATNQVCICQANPHAPGCVPDSGTTGGQQGLSATTDFSSAGAAAAATDLPGLTNDTNLAELKNQQAGSDVGGKQGAGAPIGGGSAFSGGGGGQAKAAGNDYSKYANGTGFYGSSSSGGGSGSGRSGSSGSGAQGKDGVYGGQQRPDLRQFLPGGKQDPHRGIAGTTGPDGITGPNTNIWEKVQNRYRNITPSLL